MTERTATVKRTTGETKIECTLNLDAPGTAHIETGIGFFDHMLNSLAKHGRLGIMLTCKGDLHVDDHHTVEDCALVLGQALDQALDTRNGIVRFGNSYAPLDEALARAVVDLSGRPYSMIALDLTDDRIGELRCENIAHFLHSFATAAKLNLHVDMIRGANDHHKAEAAFKATALALRQAVSLDGSTDVPSTKGVLV